MKIKYCVWYTGDPDAEVVDFEKPHGALPDSVCAAIEALRIAEETGKIVVKLGLSKGSLCISTGRADLIRAFKQSVSPIPQKYQHLL